MERLIEIPQDIVNVFETNAQTNEIGADACGDLLLFCELAVRCGRGMNSEALCIADVCKMAEELQAFDELFPCFHAAFDPESENGARAFRQVFLCAVVVRMVLKPGIFHPFDLWMIFKIFRNSLCILHMAFDAQAEGLNALNGLPRVEGRLARADISQDLHTRLEGKWWQACFFQACLYQTMIRRIGSVEALELAITPIVIAAVHNDPSNGGALPADELGGAVRDDVCAPFKRAEEVWRGERVVNEQYEFIFLGDLRHFFKGKQGNIGGAQGFAVNDLCVRQDRIFKILWIGGVNQGHANAKFRKRILELVECAAIQARRRKDMATSVEQS